MDNNNNLFDYNLNPNNVNNNVNIEEYQRRRKQADSFDKYIQDSGLFSSFQLILAEIITKKIPIDQYFTYTARRLRELGKEYEIYQYYYKNK